MTKMATYFFCAALLSMTSPALASDDWPDAQSIVEVSVLVFEHADAPDKTTAREGLRLFSDAVYLPTIAYERLQANETLNRLPMARGDVRPTVPWSMRNWLAFVHSGVLSELDQPLTGPPLPPRPPRPLLNAPILMHQATQLPEELERMADRLRSSEAYVLLNMMHWHQVLERGRTSRRIAIGWAPDNQTAPWMSWTGWAQPTLDGRHQAHLSGYLELIQSQFLRARLAVHWHEASQQTFGPLKPSHLAPFGFWVTQLDVSRSIEPDRWVYFDSESLGVLLRVSTR